MACGPIVEERQAISAVLAKLNIALPDVTLRLDMDGVIRDASFANAVSQEGAESWVGLPWAQTVASDASSDILGLVADARENGVSDFREVTQLFPSGLKLPIEYNTVRLGDNAGLLAVGKNRQVVTDIQADVTAAQRALEQDAWKLRAVETRYRLLFEAADDPILVLSTENLRIIDANPAAVRAGALDSGRDFVDAIVPADRPVFEDMIGRLREFGRARGVVLHLGAAATPWLARASVAEAEPETVFLVQLAAASLPQPVAQAPASVADMIARLPDGFVVIDSAGVICQANRAFLDLVQVAVLGGAIGQKLGRWLSHPGADSDVLLTNVRRYRTVRGFITTLHGALGSDLRVEISAAGDTDQSPERIGLLVRDISRRPAKAAARAGAVSRADERLASMLASITGQSGATPLLQLVREAGELIERHCIEAALEFAQGNRTAAAERLGLSRQSLYAKLTRYGMTGVLEDLASTD
jgi:transcriptional regulator PpsR